MWVNAESEFEPEVVDTASSKTYNYVRRNIQAVERTDDEGRTYTVYEYEELKVLKDNWELYKAVERLRADLDYVAMMDDIDLLDGEEDDNE